MKTRIALNKLTQQEEEVLCLHNPMLNSYEIYPWVFVHHDSIMVLTKNINKTTVFKVNKHSLKIIQQNDIINIDFHDIRPQVGATVICRDTEFNFNDVRIIYKKDGNKKYISYICGKYAVDFANYEIKNTTEVVNEFYNDVDIIFYPIRNTVLPINYKRFKTFKLTKVYSIKLKINDFLVKNIIPVKKTSGMLGLFEK